MSTPDALDGIWRLVSGSATDAQGRVSTPYGANPMGQVTFSRGRMLAVLCNGDAEPQGGRAYSSYGGPYTFDGSTLVTTVDVASDPTRIGSEQLRAVELQGERMVLRPPQRLYGTSLEQREIVWERVWRPGAVA